MSNESWTHKHSLDQNHFGVTQAKTSRVAVSRKSALIFKAHNPTHLCNQAPLSSPHTNRAEFILGIRQVEAPSDDTSLEAPLLSPNGIGTYLYKVILSTNFSRRFLGLCPFQSFSIFFEDIFHPLVTNSRMKRKDALKDKDEDSRVRDSGFLRLRLIWHEVVSSLLHSALIDLWLTSTS